MNADLASKNYYVILGRVPTRYVEDKIYGLDVYKRQGIFDKRGYLHIWNWDFQTGCNAIMKTYRRVKYDEEID